jgi:hypothetical protein
MSLAIALPCPADTPRSDACCDDVNEVLVAWREERAREKTRGSFHVAALANVNLEAETRAVLIMLLTS